MCVLETWLWFLSSIKDWKFSFKVQRQIEENHSQRYLEKVDLYTTLLKQVSKKGGIAASFGHAYKLPPKRREVPKPKLFRLAYLIAETDHVEEYRTQILSTFGSILKFDSTKKVCWLCNVQILQWILLKWKLLPLWFIKKGLWWCHVPVYSLLFTNQYNLAYGWSRVTISHADMMQWHMSNFSGHDIVIAPFSWLRMAIVFTSTKSTVMKIGLRINKIIQDIKWRHMSGWLP